MKAQISVFLVIFSILLGYLLSHQKSFVRENLNFENIKNKIYFQIFLNYFKSSAKLSKCSKQNQIGIWLAKPHHIDSDDNLDVVGNLSLKLGMKIVENGEEEEWEILWTVRKLFNKFKTIKA